MKIPTTHPNRQSKIGPTTIDRNTAQQPVPAASTGQAERRIKIYTYFTTVPAPGEQTPVLYNGDRAWAKVTLTLETAGPVAVGEQASLAPVLSGQGQLLQTGVPMTFNVAKGDRLYILATAVNRVKVTVEAYPWLETITGLIMAR